MLFPEKCVAAHLALAERYGASLQHGTPVQSIEERNGEAIVRTEHETHTAGAVVVTLGAWVRTLLPRIPVHRRAHSLDVVRPVAHHEQFDLGRFPIVIWQSEDLGDYYLTPHVEIRGVKIGKHHSNETCDPATMNREATADDERPLRVFLERHIPSLTGPVTTSRVCMYENSPICTFSWSNARATW